MPTALRSITSALVLKSGGKYPEMFLLPVGSFILMTGNGWHALFPIVFSPVAPLTSWSCGCAERLGIIGGSYIVSTRCMMQKDSSCVGMLRVRILMNGREP